MIGNSDNNSIAYNSINTTGSSDHGINIEIGAEYNNITENRYSPDSTIQSSIRHINLDTRRLLDTNDDKVILTAVHVHNPANQRYEGPGWNAGVSGPIDIAFSQNGDTAYVLHELSNELVIVPVETPAVKSSRVASGSP